MLKKLFICIEMFVVVYKIKVVWSNLVLYQFSCCSRCKNSIIFEFELFFFFFLVFIKKSSGCDKYEHFADPVSQLFFIFLLCLQFYLLFKFTSSVVIFAHYVHKLYVLGFNFLMHTVKWIWSEPNVGPNQHQFHFKACFTNPIVNQWFGICENYSMCPNQTVSSYYPYTV